MELAERSPHLKPREADPRMVAEQMGHVRLAMPAVLISGEREAQGALELRRLAPPHRAERVWSLQGQTGQPPPGETATPKAARDYMRFLGWTTNQAFWRLTTAIRAHDPNHLITADAILTDDYCLPAYYVVRRDTVKYLDFASVHLYHSSSQRTAFIETLKSQDLLNSPSATLLWKSAAAIAHMAPELRPVVAGELGFSVTACPDENSPLCTPGDYCKLCLDRPLAEREAFQAALPLFDARILAAGGAIGQRWWWWRGERPMGAKSSKGPEGGKPSDHGALTPAGAARPVLSTLAVSVAAYEGIEDAPVTTVTVDENTSACTGKRLNAVYGDAVAAVADMKALRVETQCTGKDSTDTPTTCVSGSPYACFGDFETCCPTLCLDAMFETVEVLDHTGVWTSAREGAPVKVKQGAPVKLRVGVGTSAKRAGSPRPKSPARSNSH